jgi:Adenine-specific methyltransferase EcoRI
MANENLGSAKTAKNDEFYTQYHDIEKEMNSYLEYNPDVFKGKTVLLPCDDPEWSNFTRFFAQKFEDLGLKKLISTSYAPNSKPPEIPYQPTLFEMRNELYDDVKTQANGKIFTLTKDKTGDGVVNVDDLEWTYLEGDGDFRSEEILRLRDEADLIITNPPFSLFREFLNWIVEANKDFVIIGNMNAITYKEVFPLIKDNKMWLGNGFTNGNAFFSSPTPRDYATGVFDEGTGLLKFRNVVWFSTIDHGRRHEPLALMTEAENIKFSRHKGIKDVGYQKYDNYDAIEVPRTESIPSDHEGVMGVPISFLSKYNPDQFEIVGMCENLDVYGLKTKVYSTQECKDAYLKKFGVPGTYDLNARSVILKDGLLEKVYSRILIRHKKPSEVTSG